MVKSRQFFMIHKFKFENNNFVIDTNSGSVHLVDDISYDILDYIPGNFFDYTESYVIKKLSDKYPQKEIKEAFDELFSLYTAGKLFSEDSYQKLVTEEKISSPIKAICLNVSHDCNLRCSYCFASKGDFKCKRELMSLETAKKAIDFVIAKSGNIKNLEMDFFGGEPLMNFEVVKETVKYARSLEKQHGKNFRFTLTTNGVLLDDEKIDFINKEIYDVVLSLDGRKETNDRFRLTKVGTGSYDVVLPKFKKLIEKRNGKKYYVRSTYTKENLNFSEDIMHIYNLGFSEISAEPALAGDGFEHAVTEKDLPEILKEHDKLTKKLIEMKKSSENINFFNFNISLNEGPCITKRLKGCGFGNDYVAITPNGDIYPCHQLVGEEQFIMGNLNEGTFNENLKKEFLKLTVYHKEKCKKCWAKFYCCGGCSSKNYQFNKDLKKPYEMSCEMQKKKIECAIAYSVLSGSEE